jgi:hypothetical protein
VPVAAREGKRLMSGILTQGLDWLEKAAKTIGTIAVLVAALSFFIPFIGPAVTVVTAWRFGVIGHAYYEIGDNRTLSKDGQFYLLRSGSGDFADLAFGDKLQAASEVRFHEADDAKSPTMFLLRQGDCVIVVRRDREKSVQAARSGGWLTVATTACGLFR